MEVLSIYMGAKAKHMDREIFKVRNNAQKVSIRWYVPMNRENQSQGGYLLFSSTYGHDKVKHLFNF